MSNINSFKSRYLVPIKDGFFSEVCFNNFIVGPNNEGPFRKVQDLVASPLDVLLARRIPIAMTGRTGQGKSHLLCAGALELSRQHLGTKVGFLFYDEIKRFWDRDVRIAQDIVAHFDIYFIDGFYLSDSSSAPEFYEFLFNNHRFIGMVVSFEDSLYDPNLPSISWDVQRLGEFGFEERLRYVRLFAEQEEYALTNHQIEIYAKTTEGMTPRLIGGFIMRDLAFKQIGQRHAMTDG